MAELFKVIIALVLVGLFTGKAIVGAITHITAWVMTKLAERGTFRTSMDFDMAAYYAEHLGDVDIEH